MKTEKTTKRELDRIYKNLQELCNRMFNEDFSYVVKVCANWFVDNMIDLMSQQSLKDMLTQEQIAHIAEMCCNVRKSEYLDKASKKLLTDYTKELKQMFNKFQEQTVQQ